MWQFSWLSVRAEGSAGHRDNTVREREREREGENNR